MKVHHNYQYLLRQISKEKKEGLRVLDYGCGKGVLVESGRSEGIDMYGVELFAAGSGVDIREKALGYGGGGIIKEITKGKIPFPDNFFDIVVSNQVFEHVPELKPVFSEIDRVVKPGGKLICIFPSKDAIREGHCEVPFVHWLKPKSPLQYQMLKLSRKIGLGRRKKVTDPDEWATYFSDWLAANTFYKPYKSIRKQLLAHFPSIKSIEYDYIAYRLQARGKLWSMLGRLCALPGFSTLFRMFCIRFGSHVLVCKKVA